MTFYSLQLLRFIAAILVLLFHLMIINSGYKGVDIFFVISGFVIYYTLFAKKKPTSIKFAINRGTKIYFLYWVALIWLFFVVPSKFSELNIKSIVLFPGHKSIVGVSWSLSFELYFYLITGTIAYFVSEQYYKLSFFALLFITSVVTITNHFTNRFIGTPINYGLGPNFWEFLLGILSAFIAIRKVPIISSRIALFIAIPSFAVFLFTDLKYMAPYTYIVYGLSSAILISSITIFEQQIKLPSKLQYFFGVLGDSSYGVYLFGPIITLFIKPSNSIDNLIVIGGTIFISILFNKVVENKALLFFRNWLNKGVVLFYNVNKN